MDFLQTLPASSPTKQRGIARNQHAAFVNNRHCLAEIAYVGNDVRGKNDDDVLPDRAQQIMETHPLFGIETGRRLIHDNQPGIAEQGLRDSEALLHAAGKAAQRLAPMLIKVGLLQQSFHRLAAFLGVGDALERGKLAQQIFRRDLGIQAEFLGQIAQHPAHRILLLEDVNLPQHGAAAIGFLQGSQGSHQGGLARAVRPQQAEHPQGDIQRNALQRLGSIGITFGEVFDSQFHLAPLKLWLVYEFHRQEVPRGQPVHLETAS